MSKVSKSKVIILNNLRTVFTSALTGVLPTYTKKESGPCTLNMHRIVLAWKFLSSLIKLLALSACSMRVNLHNEQELEVKDLLIKICTRFYMINCKNIIIVIYRIRFFLPFKYYLRKDISRSKVCAYHDQKRHR